MKFGCTVLQPPLLLLSCDLLAQLHRFTAIHKSPPVHRVSMELSSYFSPTVFQILCNRMYYSFDMMFFTYFTVGQYLILPAGNQTF